MTRDEAGTGAAFLSRAGRHRAPPFRSASAHWHMARAPPAVGGRARRRATHRQTRRRTAPQRRAPSRHRLDRPASQLASYFVWPSPGKRARLASRVAGSFLPLRAGTIGRATPTDPWLVSCSIRRRRWHVQSSPVAAPAHEMASVRRRAVVVAAVLRCSLQTMRLQKRTTTRLPDEFTFA